MIHGNMLTLSGLAKHYDATPVFSNVSLSLARGEFVALLGESGVGKSTLLNCIAGLDEADSGSVSIAGTPLGGLSDDARARLRRERLGFVFQAFHVLPHLTVAENVSLPLRLLRQARRRPRGQPCWRPWAWPAWAGAFRRSYRVGSCSAWPSPAPWCTRPA